MPFKIGNISGDSIKVGNTQISKVMVGSTKIWENWKPWSHTIYSASSSSWFGPRWDASYTIPSNVMVTSINCTAGVYSHSGDATVYASIKINGSQVVESSGAIAHQGEWMYKSCAYTPSTPLTSGTITVASTGTSYNRSVSGSFYGFIKGD